MSPLVNGFVDWPTATEVPLQYRLSADRTLCQVAGSLALPGHGSNANMGFFTFPEGYRPDGWCSWTVGPLDGIPRATAPAEPTC